MAVLVVVAGPIGAGKSTVADLLGQMLSNAGRATTVVDLDDVAFAQRAAPTEEELWRRAAAATGALVRSRFDEGSDFVVAHGPFFESDGYQLLLDAQPAEVTVRHVLLRVTLEDALDRVAGDPDRGRSKDPDFLRSTHEHFRSVEGSLPRPDFEFDSSREKASSIAEGLAEALLRQH